MDASHERHQQLALARLARTSVRSASSLILSSQSNDLLTLPLKTQSPSLPKRTRKVNFLPSHRLIKNRREIKTIMSRICYAARFGDENLPNHEYGVILVPVGMETNLLGGWIKNGGPQLLAAELASEESTSSADTDEFKELQDMVTED